MILWAARIIDVLLVLLVVLLGCLSLRKKLGSRQLVRAALLTVAFAVAAYAAAGALPPLKDTVVLTAMGEKNAESLSDEIALSGYTVDGEEHQAGKDLEILGGKWFWRGETYCWRTETDTRRPADVTREVSVNIPVGEERYLVFETSNQCGSVELSVNGESHVVDTYSAGNSVLSEPIASSSTSSLLANQLRYAAAFAAVFLLLVLSANIALNYTLKQPEKAHAWLVRNAGKLVYAGMATAAFIMMLHFADKTSLWGDELFIIREGINGVKQTIRDCLEMKQVAPPLYDICAVIWYRIAPFGERYLLLLSIVPVTISIYLLGMAGEDLGGKGCGAMAALLMATSTTVWEYAFELRAYSFVVFFSSLVILGRIMRERHKFWRVIYSVALIGLAMSHYFGMLAWGLLFLADFYAILKKRRSWRTISMHIAPGAMSLSWLAAVYVITLRTHLPSTSLWPPVPTLSHVWSLLQFLAGQNELIFYIMILGMAIALVHICKKKDAIDDGVRSNMSLALYITAVSITAIFIYGNYINQTATMWCNRYFIFLVPFLMMLCALTLSLAIMKNRNISDKSSSWKVLCAFFSILLTLNCLNVQTNYANTYPYREAADWIYEQTDYIFNPDTVIVTTHGVKTAWNEYYISRQGRRDTLNVLSEFELTADNLDTYLGPYNTIYLERAEGGVATWLEAYLNNNFVMTNDNTTVKVRTYVRA